MYVNPSAYYLNQVLYEIPNAYSFIKGNMDYPKLEGIVRFYCVPNGTLLNAEIYNLPLSHDCAPNIFGFHIHEGASCTGNSQDPFADSGMHYNPDNCPHPAHAGDLPPLLNKEGFAWTLFLTGRFLVKDMIGKTIIIHSKPDDFKTQPAGNSGEKIACGEILAASSNNIFDEI